LPSSSIAKALHLRRRRRRHQHRGRVTLVVILLTVAIVFGPIYGVDSRVDEREWRRSPRK